MTGEDEAEAMVRNRELEAVYIIDEGARDKVMNGKYEDLFRVVYLEDNNFIMMLTDIVSGDFLDEIAMMAAARYYDEGAAEYLDAISKDLVYNKVYREGDSFQWDDRESFYIDIRVVGDEGKQPEWYNQSVLLEKMTVGIIFVFIGFFVLFAGLHLVSDRNTHNYQRIYTTGIPLLHILAVELVTLNLAGLLMALPLISVAAYHGRGFFYLMLVGELYVLGMSGFVLLFLRLTDSRTGYLLVGMTVVIGMGIVSGSFFAIDMTRGWIGLVARSIPGFYSVNAYFDKGHIRGYIMYTGVYVLILIGISCLIDKKRLRSMT